MTMADYPHEEIHSVGTALVRAEAMYGRPFEHVHRDAREDEEPDFYDLWLIDADGQEHFLNNGDPWYVSSPANVPSTADIEEYVVQEGLYDDYPELESLRP